MDPKACDLPCEPVPVRTTTRSKLRTRIVVIDDHPMVRERLRQVIDGEDDMVVCGEAADRDGGLAAILRKRPGLAIVDVGLRRSSGLDLVKDLMNRRIEVPLLMLASRQESIFAERSMRAGARGCFYKEEPTHGILDAIREVRVGSLQASALFPRQVDASPAGRSRVSNLLAQISDRELLLLDLLSQGYDSHYMAVYLRLGVKTIETYRSRLSKKLHLASASGLLREAVVWRKERVSGPLVETP
jgi:DNA-binding NarL/FixJ family response regulator